METIPGDAIKIDDQSSLFLKLVCADQSEAGFEDRILFRVVHINKAPSHFQFLGVCDSLLGYPN